MSFHAYAAHSKRGPLSPFVYDPSPLGPHDVEIRILTAKDRMDEVVNIALS